MWLLFQAYLTISQHHPNAVACWTGRTLLITIVQCAPSLISVFQLTVDWWQTLVMYDEVALLGRPRPDVASLKSQLAEEDIHSRRPGQCIEVAHHLSYHELVAAHGD